MKLSDYEKQELGEVRNRNNQRGEVDLSTADIHDDDTRLTAGPAFRVLPMRVKLLETFAGSAFEKDNVVELRELAIENLDALFDRFDMRAKARLGILNADKVDVVWERMPSVVGKVPKVGSALKPLIRLLPNPGKRMELLLVEQYVIMVAASYGFDALSVDEGHIRRAILGNKSPLGVRFHTSLRTRTASLNTVARSTDEFNIDSVLERIDDLYRERFLLNRKGD